MKFALIATFSIYLVVATPVKHPACETPTAVTDINWKMLGEKTWYDTANLNPKTVDGLFDCSDWVNFTTVGDGVVTIVNLWVDGGAKVLPLETHFVRVEGKSGVYKKNKKLQNSHLETGRAAIAHQDNEESRARLIELNTASHEQEFFFVTDYNGYFIMVACIESGGWRAWMKTPEIAPSDEHIILAMDVLEAKGILGAWYQNIICTARKPGDIQPM